jgi:hypothetical protein
MNEAYRFEGTIPDLRDPVLIVMLAGWIDASGAAAVAASTAMQIVGTTRIATFDADTFIDFRARRPTMEVREGLNTRLVWPEITLDHGVTAGGRDVLFLTGPEPDTAWHRFARSVRDVAVRLGVVQVIGLGAYPFATPHTRASRLSCTTPDEELLTRVPFVRSTVDVPAGMAAALEHELHAAGISAIGVWVQVPHYVAAMSYPAASIALLDGVRDLTGVELDSPSLRQEAIIQRQRLDDLVAANPEHVSMLQKLEAVFDSTDDDTVLSRLDESDLPSGDELAAELERFLRDND